MTISDRNIFFKAGIALSALCLLLMLSASFIVVPVYPEVGQEAIHRSAGIFQGIISRFLEPNFYSVFASTAALVLYAFVTIILIHYFFEKTQSPEVLFVALFAVSFSFETARIILPLRQIYDIPSLYLLMASRVLLFGRYFGIFSLFAASVYAAGLDVQKQQNIVLLTIVAALVVALGVPIDTMTWDSSFSMVNGYTAMFRMIEAGVFLTTVISFLIAAYSRGSKEYILIGVGAFLVFMGRNILLSADTWVSPLPGIALLSAGTWFICTQLHKVYLWL
jgi:hypothetical protein